MLKLALLLAHAALSAINPGTDIGTALSADQHGVYVNGSPIVAMTVVVGGITYRCADTPWDSPAWDYCHNPNFEG